MSKVIKLKKGLDIRLKGEAERIIHQAELPDLFAVKPIDFPGLTPKLLVKPGDEVKAGSPLFFDKYKPEIVFTSPVSGKVEAVNRGERRKILEVLVKADQNIQYEEFGKLNPADAGREKVKELLLKSGAWPFIRQRPYAVVANPTDTPKSIFISGFDSAPLAPDYDYVLKDDQNLFQKGTDALRTLTDGKIHLNVRGDVAVAKVFSDTKGVEINKFIGPHPAGTIGTQIHHIDPINKGDIVWYVNVQDVVNIGKLFDHGRFDASRIVALTGAEVVKTGYYKTLMGASIEPLVKSNVTSGVHHRYISGNVLTGTKIPSNGFIGYYDSQLTVIEEGDKFEFFGWAAPGLNKFSASRTFFSWMQPKRKYKIDTNLGGGVRAYVMTGQYDKVVPMDILPVELVKSIIINDIDKMEQLGIYEVAEEDLALCEFVCTSKIEVQQIVREGIEVMIKELG